MVAYYNEHDPNAAAWLRELIAQGHIAPGDVDERSVADVRADDLRGYTQCHFFAGIGVWSHALRNAGWADDSPVWTGSCPCQPFSASGKRGGTDDQRHLWPAWFRLIRECRPDVCFGEQVASADGLAWFDLVSADLEGSGYAVGAADTCAAGVGAPHIRQRLYFVGRMEHAASGAIQRESRELPAAQCAHRGLTTERRVGNAVGGSSRVIGGLADAERGTAERHGYQVGGAAGRAQAAAPERQRIRDDVRHGGESRVVANPERTERRADAERRADHHAEGDNGAQGTGRVRERRASGGFWSDADWIACRDGKARPVEPGTFPLVTGAPARVVRLRGYGNSIVAPQAQAFIEAYLSV